ncbi:hypothetical protein VOLCADRAFT_93299 [Volvox carteri f. nagariensis]|uniref:Uncharacterized protein n=1 Tax=Volvox carteri f. nagariensis TaxID=3068 RepID=D8U1S1_VOLCA|nr:uncharacterized protein VOLCADRAFT_93299 [Volvox carteri f. nagariensis]EFJ46391.1 hypothetical protein VOLCADRAFT_93299 [Volvox carteri f. nagariensis]|eukprot:XP_002952544.1 hypothetical protein VOLCADRAFT_93299 [Volvox carteri f. nagariensis]
METIRVVARVRSREKLAENYRSSRLPRAVGNRRVAVTKICNPGGRPGPGGRNRRTYARLEPKGHPLPADKRKGTSGPNPGARSGNKWIGEPWGKTLAAKHGDKAMSLRGTFEPNAASDPGAIVALRIGGFWAPRTAVNFCGAAQRTYGDRSDGRAGTVFLAGRAGSLRWIHESQEARLRRRLTPLIEEIAEQLAAAFRTAAGTYQALDIASHQGAVARIPAALRGVIVPFPAQLLKSSRKARDNPFHSTGAGTPVSPQTPRVPGEPPFHQIRNNGHRIAALRDPLTLVHLVDREQGGRERRPHRHVPGKLRVIQSRDRV